jgi:DMSO/TMAO reductase YedYZ heme-binding membrane subunit
LSLLRLINESDQLYFIRLQQVYGLLAVCLWYVALIISPLSFLFGKDRLKRLIFARRAIGVSAFYFASLHAAIAMQVQLGGIAKFTSLPDIFQWSVIGGAYALVILGLMAATSFDVVIRFMTYRKWKWLHRLGYVGGIVLLLHIWSIGTHMAYTGVQLAAFGMLMILTGLESYRIITQLNEKYLRLDKPERLTLFIASWSIVGGLVFMIPLVIENYHSRHTDHAESSHTEGSK